MKWDSWARTLLALSGAAYSSWAAWALWLGTQTTDPLALSAALACHQRLGLPRGPTALALAEIYPQRERTYLELAAQDKPAPVDALLRLSLLDEFSGRPAAATAWMDRAVHSSRRYKTLLAAASQSSRLGNEDRLLTLAAAAFAYCPRDADDLFALLARAPRGETALQAAPLRHREDYLRYLIGQKLYLPALEYQALLAPSAAVHRLRIELAERLLLGRLWTEAERLHPSPARGGLQNARFESQPQSLAFDWRLANGDGIQIGWRPGELRFRLPPTQASLELLSQFVKSPAAAPRLEASWQGDVHGLAWQQERVHPDWLRVALVAQPHPARDFSLREVRLHE